MAVRQADAPRMDSISVIIPVFNELRNIEPLCQKLLPALEALGRPFEILFIDDGSTDGTGEELAKFAATEPRLKVIEFRRNVGQTAAMMAGIEHSSGDVLVPMDGDLQNDPEDIAALLAKLDEGYDVVSGWRKDRQDTFLSRTLPSRLANSLISSMSGVHLRDYGCTLKAYRRDVLEGVKLYGEMHRFVPIYARWQGARITEIPVRHHPRQYGESKYGLTRVFKVLLDLLLVKFLTTYETKPLYVFGGAGLVLFVLAFIAGLYAVFLKITGSADFIQTPLPLLVTLGFITGVMCILMGLLAEVQVRSYFEGAGRTAYAIKQRRNFDGDA